MFKIPTYERRIIWLLFAFSLTIATSYVVARTIGDSLFLSRIGNDQLALVFVLSGIVTASVASAWYFFTRKYSVATTIQVSSFAFAAMTLSALLLLPTYHHSFWLLASIYLLADIKGCINAINIVSALNTKLGRDSSKSAWAIVGLAAPVAAIIMGSFLAIESFAISIQTWLIVGLFLDLVAMVIGFSIGKSDNVKQLLSLQNSGSPRQHSSMMRSRRESSADSSNDFRIPILAKAKTYVCSDQFRRWIGILIAAKVVVLTIVAFEWKSSVNTYFEGETENLVRFFGTFYGVVGLATIAFQLLVTGKLLARKNVSLPILLMPVLLVLVSVLIICSPFVLGVLVFSTIGKSLDAWRRSVHDTTLNFLYTRIRRGHRRFTISFNSGIVKPLAEVAAASVIFFGGTTFHRSVLLVVLIVWILAAVRLIRLVKAPQPSKKTDNLGPTPTHNYLIQT
jgi:hypothetical protein